MTLGLVLLGALLLRLWGLSYGLPHPMARPDEEQIVRQAQHMLRTGDLRPGWANYPGLFKYASALAMSVSYYAGKLTGQYRGLTEFLWDVKFQRPNHHYLACRAASVLFGVGTVFLAFLLARGVSGSDLAGLSAAAFLATAFLHVRDSHFATVDVAMTFFVTLSLLCAAVAARTGRSRAADLAALAAGLAAATKYNGGLVLAAVLAIPVLDLLRGRNGPERRAALFGIARSFGLAVAGFAIGSPYTLAHPWEAWSELTRLSDVLTSKAGPPGLLVHPAVTLPEGLGWPVYLAALVGVAWCAFDRQRPRLLLLLFTLVFFASISPTTWVLPRYALPLLPPLCVFAALALRDVGLAVGRPRPVAALGILLLVPGLWRSVQYDRLASRADTRVLAAEWVEQHVPSHSRVSVCTGYGDVALPHRPRQSPTYRVRWTSCRPDEVPQAPTRFLVTHEHPVLPWSPPPGHFAKVLAGEWQERAVFDPFADDRPERAYYFKGDAFYMPYTALDSVERGGPIVRVWERVAVAAR